MRTSSLSPLKTVAASTLAALTLLSFAPTASADPKPPFGFFRKPSRPDHHDHHRHDRDDDHRRRFFAHPRSSWSITLGNGYAGRGYYYGPPDAPYYYQGSGVAFYSSRDRVPYDYWRGARLAELNAAVQSELRRRGYYRGPVDGRLGPASKSAISRYQSSRGLAVTGNVNNQTLRALGIR